MDLLMYACNYPARLLEIHKLIQKYKTHIPTWHYGRWYSWRMAVKIQSKTNILSLHNYMLYSLKIRYVFVNKLEYSPCNDDGLSH